MNLIVQESLVMKIEKESKDSFFGIIIDKQVAKDLNS